MGFWKKKEEQTEFVRVTVGLPVEYADRIERLCSDHGYLYTRDEFLIGGKRILEVELPKDKLDRVLDLAGGIGGRFF